MRSISDADCRFNRTAEALNASHTISLSDCYMPFFTNRTSEFNFEVDLVDETSGGIFMAMWSLSPHRLPSPDPSTFMLFGSLEALRTASTDGVSLAEETSSLRRGLLAQGATVYLNVWLCDKWYNCEMYHGYPLLVDRTPPPAPAYVFGHSDFNSSADYHRHFFRSPRCVHSTRPVPHLPARNTAPPNRQRPFCRSPSLECLPPLPPDPAGTCSPAGTPRTSTGGICATARRRCS